MSSDKTTPVKKTRTPRVKGDFRVFECVSAEGETLWRSIVEGLESTGACLKFIQKHADVYKDKQLMIAQVKKVAKVETEVTVKVRF